MKKDIIERIINKLEEYEDTKQYACDLAYTLFESENMDGTFTYSTCKAMDWIKENFEDIGEVWEELQYEFDKEFLQNYNPFSEPEKFMSLIILESASYLLGQCKTIDDNWNNEITLNKKTINKIKKELEELNNGGCIYE